MNNTELDPDYARRLALDPSALSAEVRSLKSRVASVVGVSQPGRFLPGVTVVIPTYQGVERIAQTLASLEAQDLPPAKFEVLVVPNGPDDGTSELLRAFLQTTHLNLRVLASPVASAGAARNVAVCAARYEYVTFVDDDDSVGVSFLSSMLQASHLADVVMAPIVNVTADGIREEDNALNTRIVKLRGKVVPVREAFWALGFNACKLVPTSLAQRTRYRTDLRSGEDLVYFAHLLQIEDLTLTTAPARPSCAYERTLRDDSISRRKSGIEFSVIERLACMRALAELRPYVPPGNVGAIDRLIDAQRGFISRFASTTADTREQILGAVSPADHKVLPWHDINKGRARDLAIAYCFMPYSDTSGVVAAKAIAERGRIVDVISNDMSKVRRVDASLSALSGPWVDEHVVVPAPASFAGWEPISEFAAQALKAAERLDALKGPYETLYSRALWMGSHVAAAVFKLRHWSVEWTAEFSDPLRRGADGRQRPGEFVPNDISRRLYDGLASRGFGSVPIDTSFDLVEAATLVLADQVLFTNDSQLDYMLSLYSDRRLRELVEAKAVVRPHPTPIATLYETSPTSYEVSSSTVNIAYFGSFYPNRGIGGVLAAVGRLRADVRRACRVHIFCNDPKGVAGQVAELGVAANVYVNPYLNYLEFLNATRLFDVLLVNDVARDENLPINPFLPSKYSDYRGSGQSIWALVDPGSPLDRASDITYRTPLDIPELIVEDLADIVLAELVRKSAASGV